MIAGNRFCRDTGEELRPLGPYLSIQQRRMEWADIRIQNWHRSLPFYMKCFVDKKLAFR
jgi:hypothetical protein